MTETTIGAGSTTAKRNTSARTTARITPNSWVEHFAQTLLKTPDQQRPRYQRHHFRSGRQSLVACSVAAGWSSGAMVARYTSAMSAELAMNEFGRLTDL